MFSDDVYRNELASIITELEGWASTHGDCADIAVAMTPAYWKLSAVPKMAGACPFELLLRADQKFDLQIAGEVYEDKPVDRFAFFPMLVRAIDAGAVDRISICSALTGALEAIETRVTLEDGWAWIGERRITPRTTRKADGATEQRCHRFLPYRR
jgi:hypothetical protein